jgi:hypothetical protein
VLGAGLAVLLVGAIAWWRPYVTSDRDYPTGIPQPPPLNSVSLVELGPNGQTCIQPVVLDKHSGRAWFRIGTEGRPGEPMRLTLTGRGYRSVSEVPGGYADSAGVFAPIAPPAHDVVVVACLTNIGTRPVFVYASEDKTRAPLNATINGVVTYPIMTLGFVERRPVSLLERLPVSFARMERFRPGFMGPWLFWPLAVLCVVALPLGALWTVGRAFAEEDDEREDESAAPAGVPAVDRPAGPRPAEAGADR